MEVKHTDPVLEQMETESGRNGTFGQEAVRAYRKWMQLIRAAVDEGDLYAFKSRRFKKVRGNRAHQHSLRLNSQWRLIVEIEKSNSQNVILIVAIEDYH